MGKCKSINKIIQVTLPKDIIELLDGTADELNSREGNKVHWNKSKVILVAIHNMIGCAHNDYNKKGENKNA